MSAPWLLLVYWLVGVGLGIAYSVHTQRRDSHGQPWDESDRIVAGVAGFACGFVWPLMLVIWLCGLIAQHIGERLPRHP